MMTALELSAKSLTWGQAVDRSRTGGKTKMMGVDGSIVRRFAPIAERAARTKTKVCGNRLQFFCVRPTGAYQSLLLEGCRRVPLWPFGHALATSCHSWRSGYE
jgi:hypothetical protein